MRPSSCAATVRRNPIPIRRAITREGFADDVLAVADALGAERFTIVGCSLGGVVAFELWRRVPRRIAGMVLLGTFARYPDGEANARQISAAVLQAGDMRAFGRMRAEKLGMPPDRMRETVEQMACKSVDCYLASTQATWTGDYRDVLPTINVPVLVAYGEHDVVAPRSALRGDRERDFGTRVWKWSRVPGTSPMPTTLRPSTCCCASFCLSS